jgi:hypothetical protein
MKCNPIKLLFRWNALTWHVFKFLWKLGCYTGQSIARRLRGGSKLVLAEWEGSVTRCSGVTTSGGGEVTPRRGSEETMPVGPTRILLGQKWIKYTRSIPLVQMVDEDLKQQWVNVIFLNIWKWALVLFISLRWTQWWKWNFKWISFEWDKSL